MALAAATMTMTIPEFDAFAESVAEGKHFELFDGTPLLMSNPSETHRRRRTFSTWIRCGFR